MMKKFVLLSLAVIGISAMALHAHDNSDDYYEAINQALEAGDKAAVDSLLSDWKSQGIEPVEELFAEGYVAYRLGDLERGELLLDSAETLMPVRLDFRTRHIREQYLAGQKDEALTALTALAAETAENPFGWTIDFDEELETSASEALVDLMSLHIIYHLVDKLPYDDIVLLTDSLGSLVPDPGLVESKIILASILLDKQDYASSIELLKSVVPLAKQPRKSKLLTVLALSQLALGDLDNATSTASAVIDDPESNPDYVELLEQYFKASPDTISYRSFQFTILSMFANKPFLDDFATALQDPQSLLKLYFTNTHLTVDRDLSCITAETFPIKYTEGDSLVTLPVTVWTMPEPENFIDCKYVAFVPSGDGTFRYITLEKTMLFDSDEPTTNAYVLCEAVFNENEISYDHKNYGFSVTDSITTEQFSRLAAHAVLDLDPVAGVRTVNGQTTITVPKD